MKVKALNWAAFSSTLRYLDDCDNSKLSLEVHFYFIFGFQICRYLHLQSLFYTKTIGF